MRIVLPCLILAMSACAPSTQPGASPDGVRLEVEPEVVTPGDSIELILTNESSGPVGYNLCTSGLERRRDEGWQAVRSDRVCTMELRTLPVGSEDRYSLGLPEELAPGDYRFRTSLEDLDTGERSSIASDSFRSTADGRSSP